MNHRDYAKQHGIEKPAELTPAVEEYVAWCERLAYEKGIQEGREEGLDMSREIVEAHGQQQDDDTIWCDMDIVLDALEAARTAHKQTGV